MISVLEHPRPHKTLSLDDAHNVPKHASNPRADLRAHSLPTPAPSPSPSQSSRSASASSSSAFSSPLANMLALGSPATSFAPFARSVSPFAPHRRALRQCMPVTPDGSCMALPTLESEQLESFRISKSRVVRLCNLPPSPDALTHALASLFHSFFFHSSAGGMSNGASKPTPMRMWTLRANAVAQDGGRPVWAVFASHEEACAALSLSAYDSRLGCGSVSTVPALESELEPFTKLQPFDPRLSSISSSAMNRSTPSAVMGMQTFMRYPPSPTSTNETEAETEAELFFPDAQDDFEYAYGLGHGYGHAQGLGCDSRSVSAMTTSMTGQPMHTMQALQTMHACGFTLSTNPPKARSGFRHGDWICAVPVCAAHNFGRNVSCIQCAAPRPSNLAILGGGYAHPPACSNGPLNAHGAALTPAGTRNASPRFASPMSNQSQAQAQAHVRHAQQQRQTQQQQQQQLAKAQAQAQAQALAHPLLTPSGRAFAVGGKVQNISPDPLAPCIMFWPDNEAFPDPGQIRPASLANVHQPPIMNTGNKGPIEHQPGDWVCQKCEYLNWRRRKVCQTCFPYAEGNGDSVSATMHAERLALLAAVYGQSHPQITNAHAQAALQFPGQTQNLNAAYQVPIASASSQHSSASNKSSLSPLSNYPYATSPSSHRSQFSSAPAPARRTPIPGLSVSTSVTNPRGAAGGVGGTSHSVVARRAASTPDVSLGAGNIVYQTPPSPAAARPPPSLSSALAGGPGHASTSPLSPSPTRTGPLLPSFLKHEVQPLRTVSRPFTGTGTGARTPASLSPASSTSADLPFDEYDGSAKAAGVIGSGRNAGFYAHPRGAGSGSSMGSSSSLTLAGGSIWSFERDEDKAWNGAFATVEALKGLTL